MTGSTKVFKRKTPTDKTAQKLTVTLQSGSSFLLLPDPIQPFADSYFTQHQCLHIPPDNTASFVVLDWFTEGRSARGECWDLSLFESRNEVFTTTPAGESRLLLRDAVILRDDGGGVGSLKSRMDGLTCFSTLIVRGPKFARLEGYVLDKFSKEPRIGGRSFEKDEEAGARKRREVQWTVSSVRGFLLVKVSGWALEEVRGFLRELLIDAGDVVEVFGEDCLMCLK